MANFISSFFKNLTSEENREKLRRGIPLEFPTAQANPFMDYMLERSYLTDVAHRHQFPLTVDDNGTQMQWIKICRLPIHPNVKEEYDLLARWQSVLASMHTWNDKLIFMLQRKNGATTIYVGVESVLVDEALPRIKTALHGCMPGIKTEPLQTEEITELASTMDKYHASGALTGIPSFRKETKYSVLQTLDQLAFGVKDKDNRDVNFSLIVVANPIEDAQISDTIAIYQQIGSDIHSEVKQTISEQQGTNRTRGKNFGIGALVKTFDTLFVSGGLLSEFVGIGTGGGFSLSNSTTISFSHSEGKEYLNKFAEYTEKLTDKHCERLRKGRNLGFWNVGVYVLSDLDRNVGTVLGMLRSVYSGDESYIEPIRVHRFKQNSGALDIIKTFNLIPLADPRNADADWHILGKPYQYLSTPLNTQELSLATSLPRNDVPGLRFVKTAVRFANNPGLNVGLNELVIGKIKDYGVVQNIDYKLDINALVRHSLIVGGTGSGKTCTCKAILGEVLRQGKKILIIEPAKEEYISWAADLKQKGADINIFMPGVEKYGDIRLDKLKLNPFQPAAFGNSPIDMLTRCEQATALINASLPSSDVLPIIMDETFYTFLKNQNFGADFMQGEMDQLKNYPKIEDAILTAKEVLQARGYTDEVSRGIGAAVETRLTYLSRGKRGQILNVLNSTPWGKLFDAITVINLSHIANTKDRALIMSLLLIALQEYRISRYANDEEYRSAAQKNELLHLTVIEEAHNVLAKPASDMQGVGNPQQVVTDLFSNMLSEIRAYGEGLMIVDQVPTKLISDAIKNTNYKICHRLAAKDDCDVMASALALRDDQKEIIPTLEVGNAIISGDNDDAAAWVQINKLKK